VLAPEQSLRGCPSARSDASAWKELRLALTKSCCVLGGVSCLLGNAHAQNKADLAQQVQALQTQNQQLLEQLRKQQTTIDTLSQRVAAIQATAEKQESTIRAWKDETGHPQQEPALERLAKPASNLAFSGQGAVGFFAQGSDGQFPDTAFRVDELRLFLESKVWTDVYFFGGLDVIQRESPDENLRLGEVYLDFESLSKLWGKEQQLNLRLGRFYIPFGEEYQNRYAINNPLISHSLSDLWGIDEGVELFGSFGMFRYALAVQNGGHSSLNDFTADKSVAGRLGIDPTKWLHLSVSGMRTGDLNVTQDEWSEMWFGGGFIRGLGSPATTTRAHANLVQMDVEAKWMWGHVKAFGGYLHFDDNDSTADNARDIYYYSVEGLYNLTSQLYGVTRFSHIMAHDGFPIVGLGDFGKYFFGPLTKDLWRWSVGAGYRFSPNLTLKLEYAMERGRLLNGGKRDHEDLLAAEVAMQF
jgi:hypothetical protein